MTQLPRYDLTAEPWIPALGLDGAVHELSPIDVFARSDELVSIGGELPTQGFALTRVLLAILHRAVRGPEDITDWAELWRAPGLPVDDVARYLAQWRRRFDLFSTEAPFLQVAGLSTAKGEFSGLEKLIADVPNGHPYFTTRAGRALQCIGFAEAARWVVHAHAFDPSGIKSGAAGDPRVKGGKGYPIGIAWAGNLGGVLMQGTTLRDTLLLNLLPYGEQSPVLGWGESDDDLPVWERPLLTAAVEREGASPRGPADLYTWPSRRVRLVGNDAGVTGVLVANGDPLPVQDAFSFEPMSAWRKSDAQAKKLGRQLVYMPREHHVDRAFWRGLAALLPAGAAQRTGGADTLPPAMSEWLALIQLHGHVPHDYMIQTRAVGIVYGSNNSVVDELIDDELSLTVAVLQSEHRALGLAAVDAVNAAEAAVRALGSLARNLQEAAGGDGAGAADRARELGFAALDAPFRRWVAELGPDSDLIEVEERWHRQVRRIVRGLADELLEDSGPAAWRGREVNQRHLDSARADVFFSAALVEAVPRAFAPAEHQPIQQTKEPV
ncbi:type I-E CRISPR-associated protein Cse1/CasA [Geodermatophilus sp. DF01-2]|uniref:type I-E CRISPR-associated protein Cse1/CasA n=1 Tax=Geodermatophilus sp. DF01-2 TaxID=2559610 RepID=UPI0010734705|nr:type I-E CRISPR-associated protein Cse1/CasA [Geodermatophilus sp. DF01_2]TFV58354.1 type I-E CRISPR-associated protein Cse1/CasA [Geodermatophilus sp. DF01_2]